MSPEPQTGPASRIADDLRTAVTEGRLPPGEKLPPVRKLADRYGVSRNTAAKAIGILSSEGLIVTRYGSGAYVRESHPIRTLGPDRYARSKWQTTTVEAHSEDHRETVEQQGDQTQDVRRVPADEEIAAALGVAAGTVVVERARTVRRDGDATHTVTSYYRLEDVEGTPIEDDRPGMAGRRGSLAILSERGLEPHNVIENLKARMPTVDEAVTLSLPPGEPVVEMVRLTRTADGRVIEYAKGVHAASRFEWSFPFEIPD